MTSEAQQECVLDASAVLAYLQGESGGEVVRPHIPGSLISALNWSEVLQKSLARGVDIEGVFDEVTEMGLAVMPFDAEDAESAAGLWSRARSLSLADRACLVLAARLGVPALTADRAWQALHLGVEIRLIR